MRKRICNFTGDSTFDSDMFSSNSSYFAECDCAIFVNCTEIIIPPVIPPVVPPSGGACNFTCEDIQFLQAALANLTIIILNQQDQIDMLIATAQDHSTRIATLEDDVANATSSASGLGSQFNGVVDAINNVGSTAVNQTLETIRQNGLRFGDIWWFGAQSNNLFAIDTRDSSYYKFQQGVNKTL